MKNTRVTGKLGEDIACKWLENHGFLIVERNYLKKWGELDIIAAKDKILHFVEVKGVFRAKYKSNGHRPEENVHELKIRRLRRTIQTYLLEKHCDKDSSFQFHVLTVWMNRKTRRASINFLKNIVL